jgi:hypothetical protein
MNKSLILGITLAAATSLAGLAHAETTAPEGKPRGKPAIEKIDLDKDGKISREEFLSTGLERAENAFANLDTDGDGKISKEEFLAGKAEQQAQAFERLDRNGDGILTKEDRPERPHKPSGEGKHKHHKEDAPTPRD